MFRFHNFVTLGAPVFAGLVPGRGGAEIFRVGTGPGCTRATVQGAVDAARVAAGFDTIRIVQSLGTAMQGIVIRDQDVELVGVYPTCASLGVLSRSNPIAECTGIARAEPWSPSRRASRTTRHRRGVTKRSRQEMNPSTLWMMRLCIGLMACALQPAMGQNWTSLGPDGGDVERLVIDPATPTRLYALGSGGLFRTENGGVSWLRAETGLAGSVAHTVAFCLDAEQPARLYVVDGAGVLYRSTNSAGSWTATGYAAPITDAVTALVDVPGNMGHMYLTLRDGGVLRSDDDGASFAPLNLGLSLDRPISAFAVDPANANRLLASIGSDPASPVFTGSTLYRSIDAGANWALVDTLPSAYRVNQIAFGAGSQVFALSGENALFSGGIYLSNDSGASWPTSPFQTGQGYLALDMTRAATGNLFLASVEGVFRITPTGLVSLNQGLNVGGSLPLPVASVVVHPNFPSTANLWIGSPSRGVWSSEDAGQSWQSHSAGLRSVPVKSVALHPQDSQNVLVGLSNLDLSSRESLWLQTSRSLAIAPLLKSVDAGATWSESLSDRASVLNTIVIDPTTAASAATTHVYAAGLYGPQRNAALFKSIDGGQQWTLIDQGLPLVGVPVAARYIGSVRQLQLDPRSCASPPATGVCGSGPLSTLYATASGWIPNRQFRVVRSVDAGANWVDISGDLPITEPVDFADEDLLANALLVTPGTPSILTLGTLPRSVDYANEIVAPTTIGSGVFRSSDGGVSWVRRSNGLPIVEGAGAQTIQDIWALAVHPRKPAVLWASVAPPPPAYGAGQLYKSIDSGLNWTLSTTGFNDCVARVIRVDPSAPDLLHAAGESSNGHSGCIYRSEDGGASWVSLSAGLIADSIYALERDPRDQTRHVIGSNSGLWELRLPPDHIFDDRE